LPWGALREHLVILYGKRMKIAKDTTLDPDVHVIRGYAPGELRINEDTLRTSVVVSRKTLDPWQPQLLAEVDVSHFDTILALGPEIVLLGTGARARFPDAKIAARVMGAGAGFEVMDTAAACRTFNILIGEEREVVAALLMI
jgi:uncharacterized protein